MWERGKSSDGQPESRHLPGTGDAVRSLALGNHTFDLHRFPPARRLLSHTRIGQDIATPNYTKYDKGAAGIDTPKFVLNKTKQEK